MFKGKRSSSLTSEKSRFDSRAIHFNATFFFLFFFCFFVSFFFFFGWKMCNHLLRAKCDMWVKWMREWVWIPRQTVATRHTQTGNGQPLWGNSIQLSSTVKKIESCRHLGWFNGVNIHTVELHDLSCYWLWIIGFRVKSVTSPESIWLGEMDGH